MTFWNFVRPLPASSFSQTLPVYNIVPAHYYTLEEHEKQSHHTPPLKLVHFFFDNATNSEHHNESNQGSIHTYKKPHITMATSTCKESRAVSFKTVEIYEHAYELGDNPSVSNGPPLTISWEQQDVHLLDLNQYELSRDRRKSKAQFRLTNKDRAHL
jgi:hypothetical protein